MLIKVKAVVIQVSFDQEYKGTVELTIPDADITRTFSFKFTDPAGDRTRYEVLHNNQEFFIVQAGESEDLRRQMEAMPRGRQLMLPLFFDPIDDGYGVARINHVDPQDRVAKRNVETILRNISGSISYGSEIERQFTSRAQDEFDVICAELRTLPPTLPEYTMAAE
jgi:hypothetical protein